MPAKIKFKKTMLHHSMAHCIRQHHSNKSLYMSIFLTLCAQHSFAQTPAETVPTSADTKAEIVTEIKDEAVKQGLSTPEAIEKIENINEPEESVDSMKMLQEQQQAGTQLQEFKPIEFEDLENLPVTPVDQNMANEIFQVAEEAKRQAQEYRATQQTEIAVADITQKELT